MVFSEIRKNPLFVCPVFLSVWFFFFQLIKKNIFWCLNFIKFINSPHLIINKIFFLSLFLVRGICFILRSEEKKKKNEKENLCFFNVYCIIFYFIECILFYIFIFFWFVWCAVVFSYCINLKKEKELLKWCVFLN